MHRVFETRGARIAAISEGRETEDVAVLFLHFWGGSGDSWRFVTPLLRDRALCMCPDLRGWGGSVATDGRHDLDALADDVAEIAATLNNRRILLVGHSMGGKIAQMLVARRVPGLAGLVLVAPAPPTPMPVPLEVRREMCRSYATGAGARQALAILGGDGLPAPVAETVMRDMLRGHPDAKRAWTEAAMIQDLGDMSALRGLPVSIVAGAEDRVEDASRLRALYAALAPDAAFQVVDAVAHLLPLQAPGAVAAAVAGLIERLPGAKGMPGGA
ncbi:alpha/beta fold hydrolase [Rhizosaccharibacter radicis]|uniref:Alpha/beta fold hydrolase n=1 Tax=Rhizosaccharibacter radicis TaxID=2782605 RepID=A0ABT1VSM0_9PROT|nr:alpha/beta fold hydrolase [Acetobacteraceae bacterium KSS12]